MSSEAWGLVGAGIAAVATVLAGLFAARATVRASAATAEATRAAALATVEPNQRQADLAAFKEIRDDMQAEIRELRTEQARTRSLVRAFASYVQTLIGQMRGQGIEPPAPPARVEEYNRTGV